MNKGSEPRIRVLIAKLGLDGHERGARVVSYGLRNEGMEVIYSGIRQGIDSIVQVAIQEDVDVIGVSSLSGAHDLLPEFVERLREKGKGDVLVIAGGVIPDEDIPYLRECGVSAVFGPGTSIRDIATFIRQHIAKE